MKVYKLEIMVLDLDEIGEQEIKDVIEHTRYPNHCISPKVKTIEGRDIGQWHDKHPLNLKTTADAEYQRLFKDPPVQADRPSELPCSVADYALWQRTWEQLDRIEKAIGQGK